ncbi:hypothetical protein [Ligilactobacillus acidipiscis]|uniref:Lipoprotein n=2 Tax=Ligilactobacillus acidipiscis TaxID=89059 RepID=A0A1K1KLT7_9LACO|nr:hypothetical protein [Ligilactobacillus acidipiscis]GAW63678.1 hypothetical protein Lacidipiscis_00861 [Ligilactobacillus acidipiscis]GEN20326.1 hypothetical protein LAC02_36070 [Ligilactobacillus acidipiscis]SFV39846.1 hypothetical protein LAC1533_0426 [Ligilactobacillus acidipiscis]
MIYLKIFVMLVLLVNLAGCGASISKDLESQKWEFTAQQVKQPPSTVMFDGKHVTFIKGDNCQTYGYKIKKKPNGSTQLIMGKKSGVSHRAPIKNFEIQKSARSYKLKPTNKFAKHYYGEAKLVPLKDANSE